MTCSVHGCDRKHLARGLCSTHYARWRRTGDPGPAFDPTDARAGMRKPPVELFWAKVSKAAGDGCWIWTGAQRSGYGTFSERTGKNATTAWLAHRFAYVATHGPIPEGLVLDHLCRTTLCVRPSHLEPVTNRENIIRGESPGGRAARLNRCKRGHEFTPENTIRRRGKFGRGCRECQHLHNTHQIGAAS